MRTLGLVAALVAISGLLLVEVVFGRSNPDRERRTA
jgi:hypothetical protein